MSEYTLSYTGAEVNELLSTVSDNHDAWDSISQSADYIIAQGISNEWTWRKWNSGYAECNCITKINGTWYSWGNWYVLNNNQLNFPFEFMEVPNISLSRVRGGGDYESFIDGTSYSGGDMISTTRCQPTIIRPSAGAYNTDYYVNILVVGYWK